MGTPGAGHGHLVLRHDFEDYGGTWPAYDTDVAPYTGYPFSSLSLNATDGYAWPNHLRSCRVVAGDGPRPAHSGTYYLHHQFCQTEPDPYLGGTNSASISMCATIGSPSYMHHPTTGKNTFDLLSGVTSDHVFLRFWFRFVDNWRTNHATTGGALDSFKFIRPGYGDAGDTSLYVATGNYDGASGWPFNLVLATTIRRVYGTAVVPGSSPPVGIDFDDGAWHCCCFKSSVLNYTATDPNLRLQVWFDDWNCTDPTPDLQSSNAFDPDLGTGMRMIQFCENFQGLYPQHLIGCDLDDIEIWDGEPTTEELTGTGATALLNDGRRRYWRLRYRDAGGAESSWSTTGDYFDMAITASGAITLPGVDVADGSVYRELEASGAIQLGWMRVVGLVRAGVTCDGAITLGHVALTNGTAEREIVASGAITIGPVTLSNGIGVRKVTSSGAIQLAKMTASGNVMLNNATPLSLPGKKYYWRMRYRDANGWASPFSQAGTDYFVTGDVRGAIMLPQFKLEGVAQRVITSSGAITLGEVEVAGGVRRDLSGDGAITLGELEVAGGAARGSTASGAIELRRFRVLSGTATRVVTAQGALTLGKIAIVSSTAQGPTASGNIQLPRIVLDGRTVKYATGAITLGALELDGVCAGMGVIVPVRTLIQRRYTVTTRIRRRYTVTTQIPGEPGT